ncbi:PH domain-containing protein [Demequina sp. NBRC 110056]|uniref:PH domain-containing protein n=1 Tax=Demequina sp. NBRC 110056 TaxID=1570345 RepID=UPI0013566FB6|nr:PH domain-containing protein [Demequina sp. NBRC 110056]
MVVHRLRSSLIWGWIAVGFGAAVAIVQLASSGFADAHVGLGLGLAAAGLGWAAFLRPSVVVSPDEIELRNVVQIASMPVDRIAGVELKWSLELVGDDGKRIGSFAAPVSGASRRLRARGQEGDERSTEHIAAEIGAIVEDSRSAGSADAAPSGPSAVKRADWAGIGIVVASVAAAAIALLG